MASADKAFEQALMALRTGRVEDAVNRLKSTLKAQPGHAGALNVLGAVLAQIGRFDEAERYLKLALDRKLASEATLYNYGIVLKFLKRPTEALQRFGEALALNPSVAETWNSRGTVLNDLKRYDEAIADFDKALSINPRYAEAVCNKGKALAALEKYGQSLAAYDQALHLNPNIAEGWVGRGSTLTMLRKDGDALRCFERALALKPNLAHAWLGRGNVMYERRNLAEAAAAFERALSLDNQLAEAWVGQGNVLVAGKQFDRAVEAFGTALALNPEVKYAAGARLFAKLQICDWDGLADGIATVLSAIRARQPASLPGPVMCLPASASDQRLCAEKYLCELPRLPALWRGEAYSHDRIRIAYLSADFHDHPVAQVLVNLFEHHDRSRFEITGISIGPDDKSDLRLRLRNSFEHFVDMQGRADGDVAELIRQRETDILVDLGGFTEGARPSIVLQRPAPIQVIYLGYAGTMASDRVDYLLADATAIGENEFACYAEKVVWLPNSFFAYDRKRPIADRIFTRAECGLPQSAFVFCSFTNSYKIAPDVFTIWMNLLRAKDGSVLWLAETQPLAVQNLRREAEKRGIAPERLIFAPRWPNIADHLARYRQADLFLDTIPYNAHATACDALWAGLPMVTCLGSTFVGRVAASVLRAIGLPELVTSSLAEYEALALRLSHDMDALAQIKAKLMRNRDTEPLFDTARQTRYVERAFTTMWEIRRRGEAPHHFAVDAAAAVR